MQGICKRLFENSTQPKQEVSAFFHRRHLFWDQYREDVQGSKQKMAFKNLNIS